MQGKPGISNRAKCAVHLTLDLCSVWLTNLCLTINVLDRNAEILCVAVAKQNSDVHIVECSRPFWNVRIMHVRGVGGTPRRSADARHVGLWLSHGFRHVFDAFRGSQLLGVQRACGVSVRRCVRMSFLRRTVRSAPFASARYGSCPHDG